MDFMFEAIVDIELYKEAAVLLATGVFLPSFDVYSDISLSYSLFTGTYEEKCLEQPDEVCPEHPTYGAVMLIPIILANLFTITHWLKKENTWKKRLCTFPLFILQFWPQWRVLNVLWLLKKRDERWRAEKEQLDRELSSIEPFLESVPQVHIVLCIIFLGKDKTLDTNNWQLRLSFALSVMSSAFGIAKFLKVGPCRLLPFGKIGFGLFIVLLNTATCLVGKGVTMFTIDFGRQENATAPEVNSEEEGSAVTIVIAWICINILPQVLLAFFLIWKTIGIRHTIAIILKFPAILLTPAFSFWIIGPYGKMHSKATSSQFIQEKFLIVSYFHSWINAAMTLAGAIITWTVVGKINQKDGEEEEIDVRQLLCSVPLLAFSMFVFFLIQHIDQWKCCSFLQPVTERTLHCIDNPDKVIYLQEHHEMEELEMANQQTEESLETEDVQNETKNKKDKRKKTLQRQEEQSIFDDLPF